MSGTATQGPRYALGPFHDEAFDGEGSPRPGYAPVLDAIDDAGPAELNRRVAAAMEKVGATFGSGNETPFPVDPVPRLIDSAEWEWLERGLAQRSRALNAFLADVYGDRRIVSAGVLPLELIASADHFEPAMTAVEAPVGFAPIIGFDLVRGADGRLRVLEDNLRTPSGLAYASAVRRAMRSAFPIERPAGVERPGAFDALTRLIAHAADLAGDAHVALLTDGPVNSAWYEHRTIARRANVALVTPERLRLSDGRLFSRLPSGRLWPIDVLYRRTDEDRLRDERGRPTWLADMLLEPLQRGRLLVINSPGSGVADDKLVHAYVEEMIRFYLGEEPVIESVRTYDLTRPDVLTRVIGRLGNLVIKPRSGHGGHGVVICAQTARAERARIAEAVSAAPQRYVAQETVLLSRHPTVIGDALEPRHVDLRVFAVGSGTSFQVVPCVLTRVALVRDSLIVNSSQGGGAKDTWIV